MLKVDHYTEQSLDLLHAFFEDYRGAYPDAKLNAPEFYTYHPAMQEPGNAWCVKDDNGSIIAFAPLFPALTDDNDNEPQAVWTIIIARPGDPGSEQARALLLDAVTKRVEELRAEYGKAQVRIGSDLMVSQQASIDFLRANGFEPFQHLYLMERKTRDGIAAAPVPEGITITPSKLRDGPEQALYLDVHNSCFLHTPKSVEDLQFILSSPAWIQGRVLLAKDGDDLVGSIMLYPSDEGMAIVDDVMVLPEYRGRGIAKALIAVGLRYLASRKIDVVSLEVLVDNAPAVSVYTKMGFVRTNEEIVLSKVVA